MDDNKLTKAERLAIGAAVAAPVRQEAARGSRKITRLGKDGAPVGVTTAAEVARSLLARSEIEFSVQPGKRPAFVNCKTCGRPVRVTPSGGRAKVCLPGTHRCGCGAALRGTKGRCAKGSKCQTCTRKAYIHGHNKIIDDDTFRAIVAKARTWREADAMLGIKSSHVRGKRLGIKPGGGQ